MDSWLALFDHSYLNHRFYPSAIITDLDLHLWTLFFTFYEINWVLSSTQEGFGK